mgnify:CR=1 FL=1
MNNSTTNAAANSMSFDFQESGHPSLRTLLVQGYYGTTFLPNPRALPEREGPTDIFVPLNVHEMLLQTLDLLAQDMLDDFDAEQDEHQGNGTTASKQGEQ